MDYTSIFDLITRTFADQLHGTSVFETSTGESLRVDLAIEDQYFRAAFQDSSGRILVITPGNVTAFDNGQTPQSEQTDTQSVLDAWKSQPPITLAPISAGLAQLTTANPQINQLIAQIIPSGGSLAFTLLPDLCWFDARYPQIILPGLDFKDFTGRICFRDIAFTSSKISFSIELHGICQLGQVSFGDSFVMQIQKLQLDLHSSVFLELTTSNIMGEIWHSLLSAEKGTVKINIADKPSPLTLEVEEISASFNDMKLHQSTSIGGTEKTYIDGGPVTLFLKDTNVASYDFDRLDPNILVSLVSANLLDTYIDIKFNSGKNTNPYLYGTFSIPTLTARANVKLPDLVATNLEAELSLQGQFSSSHLAIDHISLTSNTGELAFQDFKISNFTTSILVSDLISSKGKLENGQVQICLYASSGDSINVVFPPEIKKAELRLAQITNGKFDGASLSIKLNSEIGQSSGELILLAGYVEVGLLELKLDGKPVPLSANGAAAFRVSVDRLTYIVFPNASPVVLLSTCVDNPTKPLKNVALTFGNRDLSFTINKIKTNVWSVGEFDSRFAGQLEATDGKISGTDILLKSAIIRLISDEYNPSKNQNLLAVRRRLFAILALEVGGIKKKIAGREFNPDRIPANQAALVTVLQELVRDKANEYVALLLNFIRGASVIPGVVDLELYFQFQKIILDFSFDPTASSQSQLVFKGSAKVNDLKIIVDIIGEVGICPLCYRKKISDKEKNFSLDYEESLTLNIPINFDSVTNRFSIMNPNIKADRGVLSPVLAKILDFVVDILLPDNLLTINLPSDIKVNTFRLDFSSFADEIKILLEASAEKVQFE